LKKGKTVLLSKLHPMRINGGEEVNFHAFVTLALDGIEWSASRFSHFTSRERTLGIHWKGGRVSPRGGLYVVAKRKESGVRHCYYCCYCCVFRKEPILFRLQTLFISKNSVLWMFIAPCSILNL
jgi:hypothetical protein